MTKFSLTSSVVAFGSFTYSCVSVYNEQVFLSNFSLISFFCSCVRLDKFSLRTMFAHLLEVHKFKKTSF